MYILNIENNSCLLNSRKILLFVNCKLFFHLMICDSLCYNLYLISYTEENHAYYHSAVWIWSTFIIPRGFKSYSLISHLSMEWFQSQICQWGAVLKFCCDFRQGPQTTKTQQRNLSRLTRKRCTSRLLGFRLGEKVYGSTREDSNRCNKIISVDLQRKFWELEQRKIKYYCKHHWMFPLGW